MAEKRGKQDREAFRREREAHARRRAVVTLDEGSADTGTVENIISADDDFRLPGKLIVDWADGCEIGGRYEGGEFVKVDG